MSQVVRLLSRLMTQRAESWTTNQHSTCQCYTEVNLLPSLNPDFVLNFSTQTSLSLSLSQLVQTVVIVFHRQWLDLRGSQELTDSTGQI